MARRIPIILIGCGKMGLNHLRVIHENNNFDLVGVVDQKLTSLPLNYQRYPLYKSIDDCAKISFNAAVIAVPTEMHYDVGLQLLSLKKHLLIEKPLAKNTEEAEKLKKYAEDNNVIFRIGHLERLNPAVLKLKEIIDSGWLGKPIHFAFTRVGGFPEINSKDNNVLIDLAVHDIDVLQFLVGPMRIETSIGHCTWKPDIPDTAEILLSNEAGISASVHVNWVTPTKIRNIRVTGTKGVCFVDYILQTCYMLGGNLLQNRSYPDGDFSQFVSSYKNSDRIEFHVTQNEPLKLQLNQFWTDLQQQSNETKLCTPTHAISTLKLAQEALKIITSKNIKQ